MDTAEIFSSFRIDTDDKFLNAVAGAGPFTDPQTPKKFSSRKTSSTKFGGGAGGSRRSSTFFGAKFAEAFRSLTTVLTAVPVGGRNVCEEIVYTPCGTTAVLVPPSPYITPRRQTPELCGGLDYLCRQNSRGVSNPTSAFASPAKQRSVTPRVDLCNNNNNNSNTMPALYAMNRSPVPCPSTSSGGSDSAASSTKSRSRKPLPNDKYRSYTKMQRPRSCDESQPTDAATHAAGARDVTNSNYQKQFFAPTLKNSLTPTSPLPPQRPFTLDIASGGSPRRSFAKTHPLSSRIAARGCSADSSSCSSTGAGTRTYGGAAKNNNFHSASNDSNLDADFIVTRFDGDNWRTPRNLNFTGNDIVVT
uniref:Uncharacterized protein n=1 Tax=Romanomermis culicivorax TaxID=13658 RepID=A0A915K2P2_ROMCU